jgi:hypothetical protein
MLPLSSRFQGPATIIIHLELLNVKATQHYDTYQSFFYSPTDAQGKSLKNNFKIYIITAPTCFGAVTPALLMLAIASMSNALPDDGDCTEISRSCFNVNFNVNFKIIFKTIHLCISW